MPKLTSTLLFFVFLYTALSCTGNNKKSEEGNIHQEISMIEVSIGGMTCLGCEQTIQRKVGKLEGIKSVKASFTVGNAFIEYIPSLVDSLKIKSAITESGYTVKKFIPVEPEKSTR
jgi:copper chaperone